MKIFFEKIGIRFNHIQPPQNKNSLLSDVRQETILANCVIDVLHEIGRADAAGELLRRLRGIDGAIREINGGPARGGAGRMVFRMDYVLAILEEILAPPDFARIYIKIDPASNTHHATLDPTGAVPLKDIRKYIPNLLKAYLGAQKPTVYLIMGRHGSYYDKYWSLQQMIKIMREEEPSRPFVIWRENSRPSLTLTLKGLKNIRLQNRRMNWHEELLKRRMGRRVKKFLKTSYERAYRRMRRKGWTIPLKSIGKGALSDALFLISDRQITLCLENPRSFDAYLAHRRTEVYYERVSLSSKQGRMEDVV